MAFSVMPFVKVASHTPFILETTPLQKYIQKGLFPLHSCVSALFNMLRDREHHCVLDNLYMSAKFAKAAFNHPKQVWLCSIIRKAMHGIPKCVIQEEQKTQEKQLRERGTVKAVVLKGDGECPVLIAISVYVTKPVHFLSMACEKIEWIVKERKVFNPNSGMNDTLCFCV